MKNRYTNFLIFFQRREINNNKRNIRLLLLRPWTRELEWYFYEA